MKNVRDVIKALGTATAAVEAGKFDTAARAARYAERRLGVRYVDQFGAAAAVGMLRTVLASVEHDNLLERKVLYGF